MPARDPPARERRSLTLAGEDVGYLLVRRRGRRGVGLQVDSDGLTVNAPLTIPVSRIEKMVSDSERWVLKKLEVWRNRRVPEQRWDDGAPVPWFGDALTLRIAEGPESVEHGDGELRVRVALAGAENVKRAVVAWYRRAALAHLAHRAFVIARLGGIAPPRVMISSAMGRWGSCNSKREVRLSWRLIKAAPALIDYVVAHELAHLAHMNHSKAFWAEVGRLCPDYRRLRDELEAVDHLHRSF
jgi:predicted metal-dependent hydrolase